MLYNTALVSTVQESESATCTRVPSHVDPSPIPVPIPRLLPSTQLRFLCFVAASHQLSVSPMVVYICYLNKECHGKIDLNKTKAEKIKTQQEIMDPVKVVFLKIWSDCGGPNWGGWNEERPGPGRELTFR